MQLMNLLVKLVEASHCAGLKVFLDDNLKQRIPAMVMLDNHVDGLNRSTQFSLYQNVRQPSLEQHSSLS